MSKILIVEDDNFLLEMIVKVCQKDDFDVSISIDGEDALQKIQNETFDLVLLDLILPKLHGLELLEKLKNEGNNTPIIVLSNLYDQESVDKAKELGAKDYIVKAQSTPQEIVERVKTFLLEKI